ncbi:MAG TPA: DoxX family protein [Gemmatimonadales bacterium]|nr:DoxX family protein [Gemmatimonadales bacterium]
MANTFQEFSARLQPIGHNTLRIVAGLAFMTHGGPKLFGWFSEREASAPLFPIGGFFEHFWPVGLAGLLEFFGGLLLSAGVFTRIIAFIVCGEMAVVYFWRHYQFGESSLWWWANRGETAMLFCFIWLFFWTAGPGDFSVDAWLKKRKSAA